jgi:molybdopterin-containing oxidoreductase family molybdopterin binding subunit
MDKPEIYDDVWISTICGRCYAQCGIRVHRVNGVAIKIEGEPDSMMGGGGGICGKGAAGLQVLYDPNRLNKPLRRTNPEKGLFVDPKWKEISWDEALDEITERLKKVLADDPRKILVQGTTCRVMRNTTGFLFPVGAMTGTVNFWPGGGGLHCGQGAHPVAGMVHASWSVVPDFKYCNYAIYFGASKGHGSGHSPMITARQAAEARARGMKLVVFDPICNFAGGKATEWVPILPGTDAAVAMAMANVIVNELGILDATFIKLKTNGPYLIGRDGRYIREKGKVTKRAMIPSAHGMGPLQEAVGADESNKPLVWDASEGKAKVYDDPTIKDYALEGEYEVNGIKCQPAFQLIKEHLREYTPEMASEVSTVPAKTIRRIATEFAQEARVGSTITIDGHELPFRPVSAVLFRGGEGHENSHHTCFAVSLLNQIVGAAEVPGGTLGWPARSLGYPGTDQLKWSPTKGIDGFLTTDHFFSRLPGPWPPLLPQLPSEAGLTQIFTLAPFTFVFGSSDQEELWQKINLPYRFEMMFSYGCNSIMSIANRDVIAESLKKIPFIVVFELFSTELAEGFADIVLPDTCHLEEATWVEGYSFNFNYPFGMDDWCYHVMQPVVEPKPERRNVTDVVMELAHRLGKTPAVNEFYNHFVGFDEAHKLKPDEQLTQEEMCDRVLKFFFGEEHGWEWFKKHGFIRWPKRVEEAYWRYFIDARVPIYLEYMVDIGKKVGEIARQTSIDIDLTQYTPLIGWTPCSIHRIESDEYDLYCFSYRDILLTGSHAMEQPWIDEVAQMNPYTYNITMNVDTARKKGIKEGNIIEIESVYGRKVQGQVKLMEGQHPQTIGIAGCSGHWGKGMPIARGKGTNFDILLELDLKHVDPVSLNLETCVRAKVRRVERS